MARLEEIMSFIVQGYQSQPPPTIFLPVESDEIIDDRIIGQSQQPPAITVEIEKIIGDRIIGHRGPIRSIASAIRVRENAWVDPDRPLVMLFLGSCGVGKTELAKRVAHYLRGDGGQYSFKEIEKAGAFVRIDMSEYQHGHTVSNLISMLSYI
jgi:ATP-dependent Clp protease ATP-binding subunit ClpB